VQICWEALSAYQVAFVLCAGFEQADRFEGGIASGFSVAVSTAEQFLHLDGRINDP